MGKHYQSKAASLNFIPLKPPSLYHPMALGEAQVDQADAIEDADMDLSDKLYHSSKPAIFVPQSGQHESFI